MRSVSCDIAIVGLGPAGAAAAKAAAQSGLSVVAIDRKQRAGEPVQCAELVPALFAHHAPLGPAIAQPIAAMHTYVEARPKHVQPCFPGHIISRTRFDSDLVAQAQDAGAGVILGQRVTCIRRDGMIGLSDGREIFAAVIIAADGPRSLIGAAAGRTNAALIETRQITVPLRAPHDATDIFLSADIPGGYGWLFPKRDTAHVGVGVDAAFRTRLKPLLERLRSKLLDEARIGAEVLAITGGAIPAGGILDPVAAIGGRPVLLAGDAAGLANPVTGAGIAAAYLSGELAGHTAAAWAQGQSHALGRYREELEDLFGAALQRALARRAELMALHKGGGRPSAEARRAAWIAYPEYWNEQRSEEKAHDLLEA